MVLIARSLSHKTTPLPRQGREFDPRSDHDLIFLSMGKDSVLRFARLGGREKFLEGGAMVLRGYLTFAGLRKLQREREATKDRYSNTYVYYGKSKDSENRFCLAAI